VAGEVAESGGLVLVAGEFEDEDPDVADGGEYLWCGACADLGRVARGDLTPGLPQIRA